MLKAASGSRSHGTSYGYGTWGIGKASHLTQSQIARNAQLKKEAVKASLIGDYELYNKLVAEMNAN